MGESRYYPAHGARFHDEPAPDAWGHRENPPGSPQAEGAWPQQQWPQGRDVSYQGYGPREAQALFGAPSGYRNDVHDPYHEGDHMYGRAQNVLEPNPYGVGQRPQARAHDAARPDFGYASPHGGYAQPAARPAPVTQPVTAAGVAQGLGAVLSLVLLISGGAWAFQMMQRDVSGVPVVRALEGPLRVVPDNPGGSQAAHQGLSVTELAAGGPSTLPDEIVLAPPALNLDRDLNRPTRDQSIPSGGEERLIEVGLPLAGTPDVADMAPLGIVSPNRLAVTRSPRPNPRGAQLAAQRPSQPAASTEADAGLAAVIANSVAADLSRGGGVDIDPASIGPGTRLVQLGTYDSADQARSAWDGLAQRFDPLLDDRGRVIEAAHSGGSVFYRLRAHGFNDERDARQFCAALIDQKMDCIPVMIR